MVLVAPLTLESRDKYWNCLSTVFNQVDLRHLRRGMDRLRPETRFFAVEIEGRYVSVLFVTPMSLAGQRFGGIGGVCTRAECRGMGFGSMVLDSAIRETSSDFGFVEVPQLFRPAVGGSIPMILVHDESARAAIEALSELPREYF